MKYDHIPVGAEFWLEGVKLAVVSTELGPGDIPSANDFTPKLEVGTPWQKAEFKIDGNVIYKHPDFYELPSTTIKLPSYE